MKRLLMIFSMAIIGLSVLNNANAGTVDITLYDYSSPFLCPGKCEDPSLIGTFDFELNGERIESAEIYGTWHNSAIPTSEHNLFFIDDIQVADTDDFSPASPCQKSTSWSYTFSDFTVLEDGTAHFRIEAPRYHVPLGEIHLHIETAPVSPVPIPGTIVLFGSGLLGIMALKLKKKAS